jgi:uncharacterized protein (TIGR01777 family)
MRVIVSGSSGLVGTALCQALARDGDEVTRLVRKPGDPGVNWDPAAGRIDAEALEGHDAVVHLAGESIAEGRWSKAKKARIRSSRVDGTRLLAETLARLDRKPATLVSASAIGYYGDRAGKLLSEFHDPGEGFLADVCREWEAAARPAADAGIRVVTARIGLVLSAKGGALKKMLTPFRLGVGGRIGGGGQYVSWIHIDDVVGAIRHVLATPALEGPVNVVAPGAVRNKRFTKTLGKVLVRPTILPMPGFAARLVFGEMAEELLLASTRVKPERLEQTRYPFRYPELEDALRALLR